MNPALLSSRNSCWQTPDVVLDLVRQVGAIALDPCTTQDNPCRASDWMWPPAYNGLDTDDWGKCRTTEGLVYVNPPYGRELPRWIAKCCAEGLAACPIILLVPNRPDTRWFDQAIHGARAICEWRGRIKFVGAPHAAPFPSVLFYWGPSPHLFCHVFQGHGRVRVLR